MAELFVTVDVDAPPQAVWDALVDWDSQGRWMLGTRARGTTNDGIGVGGGIEAFTGIGRFGVLDTMSISEWDPPRRCVVRHNGRVVRGAGAFEVEELPDGRSRFAWTEWIDPPLGAVGQVGWYAVRPAVRAGAARSLRRFAAYVSQLPRR